MKKNHSLRGILVCLFLLNPIIGNSQSVGDIAFIAFNTDGDKDFAIVALADITPNTTIYFTDDETNGSGGFIGSEGIITWFSGTKKLPAGTIVIFTDIDHHTNPNFGASIGEITRSGSFSLSSSRDGIIAYTGTDTYSPITYLAAIQIGNADSVLGPFNGNGTLTGTALTIGSTIIVIDNVASPDGGKYSGSRSNKTVFSDYLASISDKTKWTTVSSSGNGEALLPYSEDTFTIKNTNWTGTTSAVWNLAENWDNGIPTSSSFVTIPNVTTSPIIDSGTEAAVGNLTIDANEIVTINSENALTVNGTLNAIGVLNGNSGSSIIVKGTSSGNISYSRSLTTNWHLLASPVGSQNIHTFTVTKVATNSIGTSGSNYGIALYNNNNGSAWNYYTTSSITGAGNFIGGKGYSALRTSTGDVTFTGTIATNNVAIAITDGASNKWNLIGNPYPSYIAANSNSDTTNNFLTINTAHLHLSFQAIYFWNGSEYTPINHASDIRFIAPGQGFFVNAITDGSTINFTEAMQSHQTTDIFSKTTSTWPEITLQMTDGVINKSTCIKYIAGTSTGLDPGYDAGLFTGTSNTFSIYTHLVTDSDGTAFSIQVLPDNDYENIIVPIGFNTIAGKEITFSINHQNLPSNLMVFIEDKTQNKIIRIDESNSEYKIIVKSDNHGIGRLYLRTSTTDLRKSLYTDDLDTNEINVYITSNRSLRITGNNNNAVNLTLYNLLGKKILSKNFFSNSMIDLALPKAIKSGIYILKLASKKGNINKKILIK